MKALQGKTVGFIGAGTMGQALLHGLLACGVRPRSLIASDPRGAIRRSLRRLRVRTTSSNCEIACEADVIVLAVKPQELLSVLDAVGECISRKQLVISIAAGVTRRALQARLPGVPLARVMPNLPATVGLGFAAYALGRHAGTRHRAIVEAIFASVGQAVELPERRLDAVTAVSGSGPAYLFYLAQALEEAARDLGLPRRVAAQAVRQTLLGGAALLAGGAPTIGVGAAPRNAEHFRDKALGKSSRAMLCIAGIKSPKSLRDFRGRSDFSRECRPRWVGGPTLSAEAWMARVASKRGTTEAALQGFARRRVKAHLVEGVRAAARRSQELSCRFC